MSSTRPKKPRLVWQECAPNKTFDKNSKITEFIHWARWGYVVSSIIPELGSRELCLNIFFSIETDDFNHTILRISDSTLHPAKISVSGVKEAKQLAEDVVRAFLNTPGTNH